MLNKIEYPVANQEYFLNVGDYFFNVSFVIYFPRQSGYNLAM